MYHVITTAYATQRLVPSDSPILLRLGISESAPKGDIFLVHGLDKMAPGSVCRARHVSKSYLACPGVIMAKRLRLKRGHGDMAGSLITWWRAHESVAFPAR